MARYFPLILLAIVAACAWAGWQSVPHYQPPAAADEARLRQRAAEYYRATRVFDMQAMARLYSPARQAADAQALLADIELKRGMWQQLDQESRSNLEVSAESVDAAALDVSIDGDWAETSGTCSYPAGNSQVEVTLDRMIWIRTGGDWWIYTWKTPEIAAYGNPPLEAMELLKQRRTMENRQKAQEYRRQIEQEQQRDREPAPAGEQDEPVEDSQPANGGQAAPPPER